MADHPMRIAVLGAGNGGQAMAAEFALQGHAVTLYEHSSMIGRFEHILREPRINYKSEENAITVPIGRIVDDISAAIDGAAVVNVVVPATVHDALFEDLIPHLEPRQIVIVWAGRFGALRLRQMCRERGVNGPHTVVEMNTLPYWVRASDPGTVEILMRAKEVLYSAAEPKRSADVDSTIQSLCIQARRVPSPLQAGLDNSALIVLPLIPLLNMGCIEHAGDDFFLFRDGVTPSVARLMAAAYRDIEAIAAHLGLSVKSYAVEEFQAVGSIEASNFIRHDGARDDIFRKVRGPASIRHRFILENIPFGLTPISEMGKLLGISTQIIDAFIDIGTAVCEQDFRGGGRTLKSLGIETKEDLYGLIDK